MSVLKKPDGRKEPQGRNYEKYRLTPFETVYSLAAGAAAGFLIGYIFYHSLLAGILFSAFGFTGPKKRRRRRIRRGKEELRMQFKQALYALHASLSAGRSVEGSFYSAVQDLRTLYPHPSAPILVEFERICRRLDNGDRVEEALDDFSRRSGLEDIREFSDIFATCKRTGGNLIDVMRRTSQMIGEKLEVEQEIGVLLAQKKFEAKIMSISPLAMLALLEVSSPDYMAPLFHGAQGTFLMTICLIAYAASWWGTGKLMEIEV